MNNDIYIYALIDPRTNDVKYIGATTKGLDRYKKHVSNYYLKKPTLKNNWIKSLKSQNLLPELKVLEYCTKDELREKEEFYINYFKFLGFKLLNHLETGFGIKPILKTSEEQKRNASLHFTKHPIIDLETKEIFVCIYDVLEKYKNITYTNIRTVLQKPWRAISAKGKYFAYFIDGMDIEKELQERLSRANHSLYGKHAKKKIKEITTNRVFDSLKDASETLGAHLTNISKQLNGHLNHVKGYRFEYV